jgi:hypothetical protein
MPISLRASFIIMALMQRLVIGGVETQKAARYTDL